ncbi:hypothetical protein LZG75_12135 [Polynucleobacter sp. IMCC30063]|uniref:hypothetical protein n=1 Tax=Polynucleobacter sp. IMCC30063 TaxID=2907298 RepID=UPI001F3EFFAC|nr:hypothetical protein [Polynucleobacter sp. IMCC30063]MCE7506978.1 hypothetical protein [Polynucleobacter sp. IMCC30063]
MNLQLLEIYPLKSNLSPTTPRPPSTSEFIYTAIAIEDRGEHYYWAKGASVRITKTEFDQIRANPKLFYFSTAFNLHGRINRALREQNSCAGGDKSNEGNFQLSSSYEVLKKTRLLLNTFAEIRRSTSTGLIYYFAYGHLLGDLSGAIDRVRYRFLTRPELYRLTNGYIFHKKTGRLVAKLTKIVNGFDLFELETLGFKVDHGCSEDGNFFYATKKSGNYLFSLRSRPDSKYVLARIDTLDGKKIGNHVVDQPSALSWFSEYIN